MFGSLKLAIVQLNMICSAHHISTEKSTEYSHSIKSYDTPANFQRVITEKKRKRTREGDGKKITEHISDSRKVSDEGSRRRWLPSHVVESKLGAHFTVNVTNPANVAFVMNGARDGLFNVDRYRGDRPREEHIRRTFIVVGV